MKCPCYKCEERVVGCHIACERYLEYKAGIVKKEPDPYLSYAKDSRLLLAKRMRGKLGSRR